MRSVTNLSEQIDKFPAQPVLGKVRQRPLPCSGAQFFPQRRVGYQQLDGARHKLAGIRPVVHIVIADIEKYSRLSVDDLFFDATYPPRDDRQTARESFQYCEREIFPR